MRYHCGVTAIGANVPRKAGNNRGQAAMPCGSIFSQYDEVMDLLGSSRPRELTMKDSMEGWNWNFCTGPASDDVFRCDDAEPIPIDADMIMPVAPPPAEDDNVLGCFTPTPNTTTFNVTMIMLQQKHSKREYTARPPPLQKPCDVNLG